MPIFCFHLSGVVSEPDLAGTELSDVHAARTQAVKFLGELLAQEADAFEDATTLAVTVSDPDGRKLFSVATRMLDDRPAEQPRSAP